jgi:hypothetical protein
VYTHSSTAVYTGQVSIMDGFQCVFKSSATRSSIFSGYEKYSYHGICCEAESCPVNDSWFRKNFDDPMKTEKVRGQNVLG